MSPYRRYRRTDPRRYLVHLRLLGRRGAAPLVGWHRVRLTYTR